MFSYQPNQLLPASMFTFSKAGLNCLKKMEGLRLTPYDDQTGKPIQQWVFGATIGYGKLISRAEWPKYQRGISEAEAEQLLKTALVKYEQAVKNCIKIALHQHQYDALVIFSYNIGVTAFAVCSAVKLINDIHANTPFASLEDAWKAFYKSQNKINQGLKNRRAAEWQLYSNSVYDLKNTCITGENNIGSGKVSQSLQKNPQTCDSGFFYAC
jgi:type VI secretion system secreted protein VgrG